MKDMASGRIQNINLRKLSYTITAASKITLRTTAQVYRYGQVIQIDCYFNVTSTVNNNEHVVNINKNLPRPVAQYAIATIRNLSNSVAQVALASADSTYIQAWGSISSGEYNYFQMIYLTAD